VLFSLLGPLKVVDEGREIPLGARKLCALLGLLLLRRGEPVAVDSLAGQLWAGEPPATATNAVRVYVGHVQMRGGMQFALSGTLSSMGCALPYTVGAAVAHPGRQVVCVAGDGAFTMLMGELATLARYDLPVKIGLVRNDELNQVRWELF
jgi:hypothetical protein